MILKLTFALIFLFMAPYSAYADSTGKLSDRMSLALGADGKLVIKNNYLTNFLVRGIDHATGMEAGMRLVAPSDKFVDFDLIDVEFDGWVPSVDFKLPSAETEDTEISLPDYDLSGLGSGASWENLNIQVRGGGLINAAKGSLGQGWSSRASDPLILTALDALKLLEIVGTTVENVAEISDADGSVSDEVFNAVTKQVNWLAASKERLEEVSLLVGFAQVNIETMLEFTSAVPEVSQQPNFREFIRYYRNIEASLTSLQQTLEALSGAASPSNFKDEHSKRFDAYFSGILSEEYAGNSSYNDPIDAAVAEFKNQYELAEVEEGKLELIFKYIIGPVDNVLQAYRKILVLQFKQIGDSTQEKDYLRAKVLQNRIKAIDVGHGFAQFLQAYYSAEGLFESIKTDPAKATTLLISIGRAIFEEIVDQKFIEGKAKNFITQLVASQTSTYTHKAISAAGGKFLDAIKVGEGIGNRLIPFLFDAVLGPDYLNTSIVNGELNQFGALESEANIYINGELVGTASNVGGEFNPNIDVNSGDRLSIVVGMKRPKLFSESISPWLVNNKYPASTLYDATVTIPGKLSNREILCVSDPWADLTGAIYSHHSLSGDSAALISNICAADHVNEYFVNYQLNGESDDYDYWFPVESSPGKLVYDQDELPEHRKLKEFHNSLVTGYSLLRVADYVIEDEDKLAVINISGLDAAGIEHKIHLVHRGALIVDAGNDLDVYSGLNGIPSITLPSPVVDGDTTIVGVAWQIGNDVICNSNGLEESCQLDLNTTPSGTYEAKVIVTAADGAVGSDVIQITFHDQTADLNGNQIPDVWEINNKIADLVIDQGGIKNLSDGDFDDDSISDIREYLDDTDPYDSTSSILSKNLVGLTHSQGRLLLRVEMDLLDDNLLSLQEADDIGETKFIGKYVVEVKRHDDTTTTDDESSDDTFEFEVIEVTKEKKLYFVDVTDFFSVSRSTSFTVNVGYKYTRYTTPGAALQTTYFNTYYGFYDHDDSDSQSMIAKKLLSETIADAANSLNGDNVFANVKGSEHLHFLDTVTHSILDFDKAIDYDTDLPSVWSGSNYASSSYKSDDNREPLLIIHGWQGGLDQSSPSVLLNNANVAPSYWYNFTSYYLGSKSLHSKYKLYYYHYPSYKHITYNARILNELLGELKTADNTSLGKALNNQGISILSHSMGGLVARSLIEEHLGLGGNAERLVKLLTLDTPHHGSPSAIQAHALPDFGDGFAKDLSTPGAVDLMWDNYDRNYSCIATELKNCDILTESAYDLDEDSRSARLSELTDSGRFDTHYFNQASTYLPVALSEYRLNPYLIYLNKQFEEKFTDIAKEKYVLYVAHSSNFDDLYSSEDTANPTTELQDKVRDPITDQFGMALNTRFIESVGYAAGGAQPVASTFLSKATDYDGATRYSNLSVNDPAYIPNRFVSIKDEGHENNHNIPYRYFWDYNHDYIFQGVYNNLGDWDQYIDQDIGLRQTSCIDTNFTDFDTIGCATFKREYFGDVRDYSVFSRQTTLPIESISDTRSDDFNPLKTEPVFLMIGHDLKQSLSTKPVDAGADKVVYASQSVVLDAPELASNALDGSIAFYGWYLVGGDGVAYCVTESAVVNTCEISVLGVGTHTFYAAVFNQAAQGVSDTVNVTVLESVVDGISVAPQNTGGVLTWDEAPDVAYRVCITKADNFIPLNCSEMVLSTQNIQVILDVSSPLQLSNLENGQEYRITLVSDNGGASVDTATTTFSPKLDVPQNLQASSGNGKLSLTWDAVGGAASYSVCHKDSPIISFENCATQLSSVWEPIGTNELEVAQLPSGSFLSEGDTYYFSVVAQDGNGSVSDMSASVSVIHQATVTSGVSKLNDTGITQCSDASTNGLSCPVTSYPNQDAQYGRDVNNSDDSDGHAGFSFTKLDANGNELLANATSWSCVKDNVTGLIWEVKQGGNGTRGDEGLHDADDRYNWYSTDSTNNGGSVGYENDNDAICHGYSSINSSSYCNTQAFVERVNQAGLCGANDWRLPTRESLRSIVSYDRESPSIDTDYFPQTISDGYWSSSPYANADSNVWVVAFYNGSDKTNYKRTIKYVRLVRGGQ